MGACCSNAPVGNPNDSPTADAPEVQVEVKQGSPAMEFDTNNIILLTDSYKVSHWKQYPPGTTTVYSYFESRGCVVDDWKEVTFFGLQYFLKEYLVGQVVTREKIDQAYELCQHHFGAEFVAPGLTNPTNFNKEGWEYILEKHGGKLPIKIKAVPEGMTVPTKTVLMTVENTDPKCYWLTNYLETLLVQVWYPMTVATQSREQKKSIMKMYEQTGCPLGAPPGGVCFSLNDFGFRGVSSTESAMIGGAGHLVNFIGSDTMAAMKCAREYYSAGPGSFHECPAFSIPASEHSTITSWGKERELDAMRNMLTQYPEGLVACVSDSFDIFNACENYWGTELKDLIVNRPPPAGRLVVRPDSGDPKEIVLKVCQILIEKFGSTETSTGHRLLPPYIRVIQGDGVSYITIPQILQVLADNKIAADNVVFGSGGALLQRLDRDTFKCAFKCSEIIVDGKAAPVFKDPVTDKGKASKKGRLTLQKASDTPQNPEDMYVSSSECGIPGGKGHLHKYGDYITVAEGKGDADKDLLVEVFNNGELLKDWTFDEVRLRADLPNGPFVQSKQGKPASIPKTSRNNIVLLTDSYKISHWKQYPPGTSTVYSYFESRGCVVDTWKEVTFFGLQYFLKEYLVGQVVTQEKIDQAYDLCQHHFGAEFVAPGLTNPGNFNKEGWQYILDKHGGKLPVKIKAVPEGMTVPTKTVLMTVENTDPKCYWLTNYLETLLVQVWYPMTVATQSREQKKSIMDYYGKTGCSLGKAPGGVCFSLNDFGFRGVSSVESAMIGGAGHLVNFIGSDTIAAIICARKYYNAGPGSLFESPSFSIPASEHSTITSWGKDKELDAMRNMLEQYPEGLVACVSDSFDIFNACENYWGTELKEMIEKRPPPAGRLVVRPDSGDPKEIVLKVCQILISKFGSTTTSTGHKLLPGYIRVIQGDGVNYKTIPEILQVLADNGIAADNVCFGSGGALLQRLDRDTFKCAFKCSEIIVDGKPSPVFKDPVTDKGKASKKGRLTLQKASETTQSPEDMYVPSSECNIPGGKGFLHKYGDYITVAEGKGDANKDLLVEVFKDGELLKDWSFDEVRLRADLPDGPFASARE